MRILIFPMGSAGDVHPFIAVGKALQARGHEVFEITSAYFKDSIEKAGLSFVELGSKEEFLKITEDPGLWDPKRALRTIIEKGVNFTYEPVLKIVEELHKPGETVLVASTLGFSARNARDKFDIPMASVHLAPSIFTSRHRSPMMHGGVAPQWGPSWLKAFQWWVGSKIVDGIVLPELNKFRKAQGLSPAKDILRDWWHSPDRVIGLFPEWFGPPQEDWPAQTRLTGFPLFDEKRARPMPEDLLRFLDDGPPPVVFAPGSAMAHGRDFFATAAGALKNLGMRGVLQSAFPETIPGGLDDSVMHVEYAPFSELFRRSAALVYHGGVGTCAQALRAGIPHLVQHMAHDQLDNASRVRDLGVGEGVSVAEFKPRRVARAIYGLLSDHAVQQNCARVARRFEPESWMSRTCELIEQVKKV